MKNFRLQLAAGTTALLLLLQSGMALASDPSANVPEPGPLGLLVLGGVALAIARRFSRNK